MEKYGTAREAACDSMAHGLCRLDNRSENTNALRIFNTYCCSIATVVIWSCLSVAVLHTLLSCWHDDVITMESCVWTLLSGLCSLTKQFLVFVWGRQGLVSTSLCCCSNVTSLFDTILAQIFSMCAADTCMWINSLPVARIMLLFVLLCPAEIVNH